MYVGVESQYRMEDQSVLCVTLEPCTERGAGLPKSVQSEDLRVLVEPAEITFVCYTVCVCFFFALRHKNSETETNEKQEELRIERRCFTLTRLGVC